jgi:hypothetical protein
VPDMVKRTDVLDLATEVRGLRRNVHTSRVVAICALVAALLGGINSGFTGYVYFSDRDQKADIKDLDELVGAICPSIEVIISSPVRPDLTVEQRAQRDAIINPLAGYYRTLDCADR